MLQHRIITNNHFSVYFFKFFFVLLLFNIATHRQHNYTHTKYKKDFYNTSQIVWWYWAKVYACDVNDAHSLLEWVRLVIGNASRRKNQHYRPICKWMRRGHRAFTFHCRLQRMVDRWRWVCVYLAHSFAFSAHLHVMHSNQFIWLNY